MMKISLYPVGTGAPLPLVQVAGDMLHIDGAILDFAVLNEGDEIGHEDAASLHPMLAGPIFRAGGIINLTLILPFDPSQQPDDCVAFPAPIDAGDGPVDLPFSAYSETEEQKVEGGTNIVTTTYRWHQEPEISIIFVPDPEPVETTEEDA